LHEWIYNSRIANIEINQKELQIAIKGDAKKNIHNQTGYGCFAKINNFNLVTGLRATENNKKNTLKWLN
jgi:hypothetical protein